MCMVDEPSLLLAEHSYVYFIHRDSKGHGLLSEKNFQLRRSSLTLQITHHQPGTLEARHRGANLHHFKRVLIWSPILVET